ncbi:Similar to rdx: Protein roadkill (Drosophila melanogaster) [Cotesia congregata]|uniref:Similar to rdx: Protein roadkill (Drosophila melanogaster) n=1 Tax=Cotesia congregata TaxID=51543 RepID=A0A8J2HDF0_COTCN|nr:Similar to rdx: Protein roadkill (Drosophila melanogaster) [Cotesia congregata]
MKVRVIKNDIRKAVSIMKICYGELCSTGCVVDWKDIVYFDNLHDHPNTCILKNGHEYTVPITCTIIWNGFVDDLYYSNVCTHMKRLYDNKEFSDMVIKIRDDEFPAHKILISALSHVFHTMLTTDMKESKENSITFSDTTDTDVIKELLLFVYKGKMDKAETDAELALKLCNFAHMYQINKLKTTCEYILIKSLTNENASTILTEDDPAPSYEGHRNCTFFFRDTSE